VTLEGGKPPQGSVFLLGKGDTAPAPSSTCSLAKHTCDEGDMNWDMASHGMIGEESSDKLDPHAYEPR
jgi:hypothetical protein